MDIQWTNTLHISKIWQVLKHFTIRSFDYPPSCFIKNEFRILYSMFFLYQNFARNWNYYLKNCKYTYYLYVVYIFCTIWIRKHFAWLDFLNSVDAGYSNAGMI